MRRASSGETGRPALVAPAARVVPPSAPVDAAGRRGAGTAPRVVGAGAEQPLEHRAAGGELGLGPAVDDPAPVEDDDPVGQPQRGAAVGDEQDGLARRPLRGQGRQDPLLDRRVDGRRRVVEDQHAGRRDEGAGQADALALPPGQRQPLLADEGVPPVVEGVDETVGRRGAQRGPQDLLVRVGHGVGDVGAHGVGEQERLLEDHADRSAQLLRVQVPHVDAADLDAAGVDVVEAVEQGREVDLPEPAVPTTASVPPAGTSRSTSRRTGRPGRGRTPRRGSGRPAGRRAAGRPGCGAVRGRWDGCPRPAGPARPRAGLLPDRQQPRELAHGRDHAPQVGGEGQERADREVPGEGQPAAEQQHPDLPEGRDRLQRRAVAGVVAHDAHPVGEQVTDRALEAGQFGGLLAEPLDHAHPRDGGLDAGRHLGGAGLRGGVRGEQVPAAAPGDPEQGRPGGQATRVSGGDRTAMTTRETTNRTALPVTLGSQASRPWTSWTSLIDRLTTCPVESASSWRPSIRCTAAWTSLRRSYWTSRDSRPAV